MRLVLAFVLILSGCSDTDLPEYKKLGGLRILAMVAANPEITPGGGTTNVTVTPYISDVDGLGANLSYTAETCLDPGIGFGAEPSCDGALFKASAGAGAIGTLNAGNRYTAAAAGVTVAVPSAVAMFAGRSAEDQFNGIAYLLVYTVTRTDGTTAKAIKRVLASTNTTNNSNPAFNGGSEILADGSPIAGLPTTPVTLTPSYTAASAETYQFKNGSGDTLTLGEKLVTTWFSHKGTISTTPTDTTNGTVYTPDVAPEVVVAVLRDGRGGVAIHIEAL